MNYIIRVENKDESKEVLTHYKTTLYPTANVYPIKLFISDDKYTGWNPLTGSDVGLYNPKRLSFSEWKEMLSPAKGWKVGDSFTAGSKDHKTVYTIYKQEKDIVFLNWPGDEKGTTYIEYSVDINFKEGHWILKQTNMTTKEYFAVQGSKWLKQAFMNQLESEGFKPAGNGTKGSVDSGMAVGTSSSYNNKEFVAITLKGNKKYTLPQDYEIALEAFRTFYAEEIKVGDVVCVTKELTGNMAAIGKVGKVKKIDLTSNIKYYLDMAELGCSWYYDVRLATKEETAEWTESNEKKTVMVEYAGGSFAVEIRKGNISADGMTFSFEDLNSFIEKYNVGMARIGGWQVSINTVDIGCKQGVKISSLEEVVRVYNSVNK